MTDYIVTYDEAMMSDRIRGKRSAKDAVEEALTGSPLSDLVERGELDPDDTCQVTTTTTEHEIAFNEVLDDDTIQALREE